LGGYVVSLYSLSLSLSLSRSIGALADCFSRDLGIPNMWYQSQVRLGEGA